MTTAFIPSDEPVGVIKIEAGLTPPAENRKGSGVINDTPVKPIVIARRQK